MKFNDKVRELIYQRAGWRCELCGLRVDVGQVHHRRPRGMGGSKNAIVGSCANGVLLHPRCHARIESHRSWAQSIGFLVSASQQPDKVPVRRFDGWVYLGEDGSLQAVTDVDELINLAGAERVAFSTLDGLGSDEPLDGALTDAKSDSSDVAGGSTEVRVVADSSDDASEFAGDRVHESDDKG